MSLLCIAGGAWAGGRPTDYVRAVREYADNVLRHGRDTIGPKRTPMFFDGLAVDTLRPPVWRKDGEQWVLANLASQQNLIRTMDGLTGLTGERRYRGAAARAVREFSPRAARSGPRRCPAYRRSTPG